MDPQADDNAQPTSPSSTDPKAVNRARFELELEFNFFEQPAFINYLEYLLYWKEKEYARFIHYPHALHHLELLQTPEFRAMMKKDEALREYLQQKQHDHWRSWRDPNHLNRTKQPVASESHDEEGNPTSTGLNPT
ncbi:suppressor of hpr1 [Pleurotus pulmonarius]|nr:suppressor of hpr1 [Pleurotus pulmonarius]KAF4599739.1 suppressor of hpr1 [Pleurotus pulmonarius]